MKSNIEKLGDEFMGRIAGMNRAMQPPGVEFGTVQGNMSLMPDNSPGPVPKGEYMICRQLTLGSKDSVLTQTKAGQGTHPHGPSGGHGQASGSGVHSHPSAEGEHVHDVLVPELMRGLKPGDRVLICWVGYTAVIMDVVCFS